MASNDFCSICGLPAEYYCVCADFPLFCVSHKSTHESKRGFHFFSPIGSFEFAQQNKQQYRVWAVNLASSHHKLKEDFHRVYQCRNEIEAAFACLFTQLTQLKSNLLEALEQLEIYLRVKVEEVMVETSESPFYTGSSQLATSIYDRCSQETFNPLEIFAYQVTVKEECLQDCLDVSFHTIIPELSSLNRSVTGGNLRQELADLRARCEQLQSEVAIPDSYSPPSPKGTAPVFVRSPSRMATHPSQASSNSESFASHQAFSKSQPQSPQAGHIPSPFQPPAELKRYASDQNISDNQDEPGRSMFGPGDGKPRGPGCSPSQMVNTHQQRQEPFQHDGPSPAAFAPEGGILPGSRPMTARKLHNPHLGLDLHLPSLPRPTLNGQSPRFTGA